MAENNYDDPAGSTQMFRAFVETPQAQAPSNVSVHRSGSGGSRTGVIAIGVVVALVVVVGVIWLAVK
ncbi:hypothetical protein [Kitasatospora viridis]|uniref:Uncharacterized protein n=1 Tax=Kitasatospora viridis TaxID=281105 RepID=A0A561UI45_9ACTN|nr:hypothetical protein [Kitasatospora viridis]TWF99004.1 hypothetical protein FHX73_112839 [Kitasatospora viridis]